MMAGPLLLSWRWVGTSLGDLSVRRRLPQGVCAGDLLVVNVELANTRRRVGSWAIVVEEQIQQSGQPPIRPSVYFPYVPAGQSREAAYAGRLTRRGRYAVGPFRVSTRFPFGLFRRTITLGEAESLVVFPRLGRLAQGWLARHHEAFEGSQRQRQRYSHVEGEFYGVRDWRSGDSRRSIHWWSSARRGGLVVRQFDQPHNRDVAVLVDLWQPARPEPEDLDHVELAVSFAATVISDLVPQGRRRICCWGRRPTPTEYTSGPASMPLVQDAMERLALAEADSEDRLPELLAGALGRIEPGTDVILVTTRPIDLGDARAFRPAVAGPRPRGDPPAASASSRRPAGSSRSTFRRNRVASCPSNDYSKISTRDAGVAGNAAVGHGPARRAAADPRLAGGDCVGVADGRDRVVPAQSGRGQRRGRRRLAGRLPRGDAAGQRRLGPGHRPVAGLPPDHPPVPAQRDADLLAVAGR